MLIDTETKSAPPAVRTDEPPWALRISASHWRQLDAHLFPGDGDEHAAVIACGIVETACGTRLLARQVFLARDGVDFVPGTRGYKMLTAEFVSGRIRFCRDQQLAYVAVHNHGPSTSVAFSGDDLRSHARGYPALLDIGAGTPVGALVTARGAVAGDIWTPDRKRRALAETVVVGANTIRLHARPPTAPAAIPELYDRQGLLFGAAGQARLRNEKVAIIGAGGVGMIVVSLLARLGVGHLVVIDPDRVDLTNLPRLPEATRGDARALLTHERNPAWLRHVGRRLARPKVKVAARVARRASRAVRVDAIVGDVVDADIARAIVDADTVMLAADSQQARVLFNALVHQHLIPGWQIGSKIQTNKDTGAIVDVFSVVRRVIPDAGCLWCNGAINPARLAEEALDPAAREAQRYVDDLLVAAPSVITLNAIGAAAACNDYMLATAGLLRDDDITYRHEAVQTGRVRRDGPRRDIACRDCGEPQHSRFAFGGLRDLPWRSRETAVRRVVRRSR